MQRKSKKTSNAIADTIVQNVDTIIAESLHGMQVALAGLAKIPDPQMEIRVLLPDGRIRRGKTKGMPDNAVPTFWDMEMEATK